MKCLFIGGPKAGQFIDVDYGSKNIAIPVPMDGGFGEIRYTRGYLETSSGETHTVFYLPGEVDPIEILMNFYTENQK